MNFLGTAERRRCEKEGVKTSENGSKWHLKIIGIMIRSAGHGY